MKPQDQSAISESPRTEYKGWVIPGPRPPGANAPSAGNPSVESAENLSSSVGIQVLVNGKPIAAATTPVPSLSPEDIAPTTLDAISGHWRIYQYKDGHRYSTDDVLVAWYGTTCVPRAERVLDLGSGIGSVALIAAWRLPAAQFVTIEAQEISYQLARQSAAYNGLGARMDQRLGDLRDRALLRDEEERGFDLVMGSPPYFPLDAGLQGNHPQKVACRFELRGTVADYCQTALRALAPGGVFTCVFPEAERKRALEGARAAGLSVLRIRPVIFKEGEPPLVALYAMMRREDLPESFRDQLWEESPLVIRMSDGRVSDEYSRIKLSIGFPP